MIHVSKRIAIIVTGLIVYLGASPAQASGESMRCATHLIYAGSSQDSSLMYEVLKKCGEPEAKLGNTWIYTQRNVQRVLTFNHLGRLVRIESSRN